MVMGCSKEELQEIRIGIGDVRSGEIGTKAGSVSEALAATVPTGTVNLVIAGVDVPSRLYYAAQGESVMVPLGRYRVTGQYRPTTLGTVMSNKVWNEPGFDVSGEITVAQGVVEYSVPAEYVCWALVLDRDKCEKYMHRPTWDADWTDVGWMKVVGDYAVMYVGMDNTLTSARPYRLRAVPSDVESQEAADYAVVTEWASSAYVNVEAGKWYRFGARDVTFESGTIGVTLPEWEQGN